MIVKFIAKQKGALIIPCPEISARHTIGFARGRYKTANKQEIRKLLSDDTTNRYAKLAPGQDLEAISEYLESDEKPDVITKEYLSAIPFEAWKELMEVHPAIEAKFPLIGLAKAQLIGKPTDDIIEAIVEKYKSADDASKPKANEVEEAGAADETEPDEVEEVDEPAKKSPGIKLKKPQADEEEVLLPLFENGEKKSKDFTVKQIHQIFEDHEAEELREFISEDEDRDTVFKYWNQAFPEFPITE